MRNSSYFNSFNLFLSILLCLFAYSVISPITIDFVYAKSEEKQKRNEEKQERRAEKRRRQAEKEAEDKSDEEREKDQERRIKQLERGEKQSGILGWIDKVTSVIPVVNVVVDTATDVAGHVIPSAYCENNCGVGNLPRSDSHAWTCKDKGHDSPVVVWMCYEATVECPKASEHFSCAGQNSHNRNQVSGSDGNKNPDCTICWGSGACTVCDNTD